MALSLHYRKDGGRQRWPALLPPRLSVSATRKVQVASLRQRSISASRCFERHLARLEYFQRVVDPALRTYKQPATLRFEDFARGAILGRSGHHLVLHMSKNWGGYSQRKSLFDNLLHWPPSTSPKFNPPIENAT